MEEAAFHLAAVALEFLTLLCVVSHLWHPKRHIPSSRAIFQKLVNWCRRPMSQQTVEELDLLRCKTVCQIWRLILAVVILRTFLGQILTAFGTKHSMPPMDIVYFVQGFGALLVTWKPQIITPKTLDAAVIVCFLAWNISLLPLSDRVDARDVVTVSFTVRFVFSVMARRHSTVIICLLLNFLQVGWMASVQSDMHVCGSQIQQAPLPNLLFSVMVLMAVGLYIARKMMEDNAMLKQALEA